MSVSPISTASTPTRSRSSSCSRIGEQLVGPLDVDREVGEVAVVDAEDVGVDVERALELVLVVDLDEDVEIQPARLSVQLVELVVVEHGDDQEDRVRAGRRRLVELVGLEDEVLTQHRQLRGRDRVPQVLERAAEVHALRDDRQRRRATPLIGLDDLLHRRALADDPGRRRAPLVLGDHGQAGARERLAERPALRPLVERRLQLLQRRGPAPTLELLPRRLDDPLENVQEGANCCVSATSVSSASAAAPESSACSAARTPRSMLSARPAT